MKILQKYKFKTLLVTNDKKKLLGTLNDGDIRRAIIAGAEFDTKVLNYYNKKPQFIFQDEIKRTNLYQKILKEKIFVLPVLNKKKKLINCFFYDDLIKKDAKHKVKRILEIPCIIMAGGKGKRLLPFSNILPKPLLPMNNKTVIENIMTGFYLNGINNFIISLNYKAKILRSFFSERKKFKVQMVEEKKSRGTIGSLSLLKKYIKNYFFVTNCDTIIDYNYSRIIKSHIEKKSIMTMIAAKKNIAINYGVCKLDKQDQLVNLEEKPSSDYLVNTGMYLFSIEILKYIPRSGVFDITDLVKKLKKNNKKIDVYNVGNNNWTDVGTWEPYIDTIRNEKNENL